MLSSLLLRLNCLTRPKRWDVRETRKGADWLPNASGFANRRLEEDLMTVGLRQRLRHYY
jgi:hypothetical protein